MWRLFRRKVRSTGVRGEPVHIDRVQGGGTRSVERHETAVERLGLALAKERRGRRRLDRIAGYEAELRRHLLLLAKLRGG